MRSLRIILLSVAAAGLVLAPFALAEKDEDDEAKDKDKETAEERREDRNSEKLERREERADPKAKPHFAKHGSDKWLLKNDQISVWFHQGKNDKAKPQLRVFQTGADGNRTGYQVEIKRIIEVGAAGSADDDDDDDGALGDRRVFHAMNLARADDWNVQTAETNDSLAITMVRAEAQGIVTLVFHVSKTAPSVKFDARIDHWRWAEGASDHRLALVMITHERSLTRHGGGENVTFEGGYVTWAPTATLTYGNVTRIANVTAVVDEEESETERDDGAVKSKRKGRLALVFDAPGGYDALDYDPEFGVMSAGSSERVTVPVAGAAIAIAGVAAAAAVLARPRRR